MSHPDNPESAAAIVARLSAITGAENDSDLARRLGVSRDQVSKWQARDSRPYPICLRVAKERGVSLDWLLTGEGPMRRAAEGPGEGGAEGGAPKSDNLADVGEVLTPREVAVLTLYRALDEDAQREIHTVAEEKKRLRDIERQLQEVRAELAAAKQRP